MGTIVCKECGKIISAISSEKSEIVFSICEECCSKKIIDKI